MTMAEEKLADKASAGESAGDGSARESAGGELTATTDKDGTAAAEVDAPEVLQPGERVPKMDPATVGLSVGVDQHSAAVPAVSGSSGAEDHTEPERSESVEQPGKVMRIGSMVKQLLEEVRNSGLDEASRNRLRDIHQQSITELASALSPDLAAELDRMALPFDSETPTEAELRIAQAQLVGWLEGLFHGIQATLMAQQMAARQQLDEMRSRGLPMGSSDPDSLPHRPGTYL
jgi:hypothetical protein